MPTAMASPPPSTIFRFPNSKCASAWRCSSPPPGVQPNDEEKKRIRGQILDQLENEKLELQEAIKKHITVAPGEVDNQINHMLTDNHLTMPSCARF